ncbi:MULTISPECIES: histidine triad nucleotide-binding protein [Tepidanaerobacter]|uniref:Histidine triad (HIT) family protein n=1 Tax=Tepidanaerobacter syntrophicus TaxID=224999 RepID=A0A0U9HHF2_9FIRM|nr:MULTISPECIES: histidine triad nucleotide-binding protein [Tepidanaerobacter]GAQ25547.1 histidine triad (HIT) family protein [Tepidanaerobacter syntrophicus]GLI18500.1 histidine triad nucleotide-binding protein [Tepidanaerobacter syntrophicus]GLI49995.1 histidine triad nucleotide-binding protein [Tepidanaerobacter syntrophicus]HHV83100.1 histidine triad nucleotide-binding protein [Tepidanaerobacter syntrophicus]
MDCVFCKIINKEIPAKIVYEDEDLIAINDANPQAPIHLLLIPKQHLKSIMEINDENAQILEQIIKLAQKLAGEFGIDEKGFRLVVNTGNDGGQTVPHLHFHLLGGRFMKWPPG